MTRTEAREELRSNLERGTLDALLTSPDWRAVLDGARPEVLRLYLSVPDDAVTRSAWRWDAMELDIPAILDGAPVTEPALTGWVTTSRPGPLLRAVYHLLDEHTRSGPEPNGPVSGERFLELVVERAPAALLEVLSSDLRWNSRATRRLIERFAEPLVDSMIASGQLPESVVVDLPIGALPRLLRGLAAGDARPMDYALRRSLPLMCGGAIDAPDAFAEVAEQALGSLKKSDSVPLDAEPLGTEVLARMLNAVKGKAKPFEVLATDAAAAATPASAEALAGMLGDKRRGRAVARWLAVLGPEGRAAARAAREAATSKRQTDARARELVDAIERLPEARSFVRDITNKTCAPWHLDPASLSAAPVAPAEGTPPHAPIALAEAEPVLSGRVSPTDADLSPAAWADLLQIRATRGWRVSKPASDHARAQAQGRLGWGPDPGRMMEAVDRLAIRPKATPGLFDYLLGADAPRWLLRHAIGATRAGRKPTPLGAVDDEILAPLDRWRPDGHEALALLARHVELHGMRGLPSDELARYPALEEARDAGTQWRSTAKPRDFRLHVTVRGAREVRVEYREGLTFHVDLAAGRWSHDGVSPLRGATSLFGDEAEASVDLEVCGPAARLGVGGTLLAGMPQTQLLEGLPEVAAPICVSTDGELARVLVTSTGSRRAARENVRVIAKQDESALRDVAGEGTPTAALTLATAASLGDEEAFREAAARALGTMGEVAGPWREALSVETVEEGEFAVRSFDACLRAFEAVRGGTVVQYEPRYGESPAYRMMTDAGAAPSDDNAVVADTLYLITEPHGDELEEPGALLLRSLETLHVWNVGGPGAWAADTGRWLLIASDHLEKEDPDWFDFMSVRLAAWQVEEGVALAAWRGEDAKLAPVMGLPGGWPPRQSWTSFRVWIGE